jgi:hypothetical protein
VETGGQRTKKIHQSHKKKKSGNKNEETLRGRRQRRTNTKMKLTSISQQISVHEANLPLLEMTHPQGLLSHLKKDATKSFNKCLSHNQNLSLIIFTIASTQQ